MLLKDSTKEVNIPDSDEPAEDSDDADEVVDSVETLHSLTDRSTRDLYVLNRISLVFGEPPNSSTRRRR